MLSARLRLHVGQTINLYLQDDIGYCYDLCDIKSDYYKLYLDLTKFWQLFYADRILLDYEILTKEQEKETRKLLGYLDLDWEDRCLSPEKNERLVKTASSQQVRKKVYKGSSLNWRKFKPYLNGAFDTLR